MDDDPDGPLRLDVSLLRGLRYACRPDCGLCCYATPRVERGERTRLLQIVPGSDLRREGGGEFLRSRGDGGACVLLRDLRCRGHGVRPYPCREFPVTVHVGDRLQASAVLSCPGVELDANWNPGTDRVVRPPVGFEGELGAVRGRLGPPVLGRISSAARRHRKIVRALEREGRWEPPERVRSDLGRSVPRPTHDDFPVGDPPAIEAGRDLLPLFFDGRPGPVGIAAGLGGWELEELAPEGGGRSLGVIPPPERRPEVTGEGWKLLEAYLAYWLARDQLFAVVELEMAREDVEGSLREVVASELRAIGALVLARADVRARLSRGPAGQLTFADVTAGIRATDQDLLDRDGWGETL